MLRTKVPVSEAVVTKWYRVQWAPSEAIKKEERNGGGEKAALCLHSMFSASSAC